ncbi:molybdopterin-dependent oxidoreductase [Brassicibacter mesophilus]|uniref:molybdopterin-dependent oxidoreductase n=1 Tax=Brassicibacter mesophilus TaxID=745119 RepID=UPI003D2519E5
MKRKLSILLVLIMTVLAFTACSNGEPAQTEQKPEWTISIETADGKTVEFTNLDTDKAGQVDIKATMKKKDGSETEQSWTGTLLSKVLETTGVESFTTIIVEAADGYSKEYTPDLVNSDKTILGTTVDGQKLGSEDGPVQLVVDGKGANWWIKNVAKIKVNK